MSRGLARVAAGVVPTLAGLWGHGGGKLRPSFPGLRGDVQGLDRPESPEMGPAEGTPIPPLTHRTEPSDGERGRPQNPTALRGFALSEGGDDDEAQQPCEPCFPHCGRGKEKRVRRIQGRDVLGISHVCLHQLTRTQTWMGDAAHRAQGFPRQGSGGSMALAQGS